jgi:Tfp pilus assembly protein PilX
MIPSQRTSPDRGSTIVMVLLAITVLSSIAAVVITRMSNQHLTNYHSASWQEALNVAEAGVETGLSTLNLSISNPTTAWTNWTPSDATTFPKTYRGALLPHGGDGNNKMYVSVQVDNDVKDSSGEAWYRIRAIGTTELPGPSRLGFEKSLTDANGVKNHRSMLMRMSFSNDATSGALHLPQVSRKIEVMVPALTTSLFVRSITVWNYLSMSGGAYTDSFDSRYPSKSTNGLYDVAKRKSHGDVAINSSGSDSNLRNSVVYGNASSNGGAIQNPGNVQGSIYNNFSTNLPPVSAPVWTTMHATPILIRDPGAPVTLTASASKTSPANYKLTELTVSSDEKRLTWRLPSRRG